MSLAQPPFDQSLAEAGLTLVSEPATAPTSMHPNARRRLFEVEPAVRQQVPLLLGLTGPSGSGKTYSALRLATGIAGSARAGHRDDRHREPGRVITPTSCHR